jgi:hypothetical protein
MRHGSHIARRQVCVWSLAVLLSMGIPTAIAVTSALNGTDGAGGRANSTTTSIDPSNAATAAGVAGACKPNEKLLRIGVMLCVN